MGPITISILAAAGISLAGGGAFHSKKSNKILIEQRHDCVLFVNDLLADRIVFRKLNMMGIFSNQFRATNLDFECNVLITNNEIQYMIHSIRRKHRLFYHFIYNRSKKIGQKINGDKEFMALNDILLHKLDEKIINYGWDNPITHQASKTIKIFTDITGINQTNKFDEKKIAEFEIDLQSIEKLYYEIKEIAETYFDEEDKHILERLYNQDLQSLKNSYLLIENKSDLEINQMKESLHLIQSKLTDFHSKAQEFRKQDFKRNVEILKNRDK